MGDPQERGGSAGLDLGGHPGKERGDPGGFSRAGHGDPPERGGSSFQDMGDIPGRKGGARLGWTGGCPLREGGSPGRDLGGHPGRAGNLGGSPWERGVWFVWTWGDTPGKWGPGGASAGQDVGSAQEGGGLSSAGRAKEGPLGMGAPQERGFSFPGHRRTQTRASRRGSRSS